MKFKNTRIKWNFLIATYIVVLAYVLMNLSTVSKGTGYIFSVIKPFVVAIGIAFVLNIPMKFFENKVLKSLEKCKKKWIRGLRRPLAIVISIILIVALFMGVIIFVIPQLSESISSLVDVIPKSVKRFEEMISNTMGNAVILGDIISEVLKMWKEILKVLGQVTGSMISKALDITIGVTSTIVDFFLSLVLAIYMLASKENLIMQIKKTMYAFLNKEKVNKIMEVSYIAQFKFTRFIVGQCTEACIIGCLCFIGMTIFSFPYALLISVLIGTTALIPILGAFIGTIPAAFIILMISPIKAFWFIIFIIVMQQIEGNLIYPRVVGNSIGLTGIWIMFAMMVGGSMFGIMGMLIGVPLFGVIYTVLSIIINKRLKNKQIDINNIK
ncbi:AI-2E family transporter [Clostridium tarantellae]|uniref:AI-2E family transporter n=1 Tax=Clostridium tarantellae TaxID=39493 RepID=A0A6I1MPT3_9CLOT|nr:AI-2E family transporter [Clostridium tarantellae]MPQ44147.1 AI-2E family transporter [Clostridium tarantellae]